MKYLIYALTDPRTGETRYIGKSQRGLRRPEEHKTASVLARDKNVHKVNWIRLLQRLTLNPTVVTLWSSEVGGALGDAEKYWIAEMRNRGHRLLNLTPGGDGGVSRPRSLEARRRMSEAALRERASVEAKTRMSAARKKALVRPNVIVAMRKQMKPVVRIDPKTGERVGFESISSTKKLGFDPWSVYSCIHGRQRTHLGYGWEFA